MNEARELDDAGLRYGAMHRYLQASLRAAPLLPPGKPLDAPAVRSRLKDLRARLAAAPYDNSIGQLWVEYGEAELEAAGSKPPDTAAAVAGDVLPRYLAALVPGRPVAPRPAPEVTVTLVRWPYT